MASTEEFVIFVCEQLRGVGDLRYRKMFGDYMVYVNEKPILLVCDNTVYVKTEPAIAHLMEGAPTAVPYEGAKLRWVLDMEKDALAREVVTLLEQVTPVPKPKKRREKQPKKENTPL